MISQISIILLFHFILSWFGHAEGASLTFNVVKFGAKPDGNTDSTQPFLRAWASACAAATTTTTIYVPKGRYLLRSAEFRGPCKSRIKVQIDGTLVAPMDHRALQNSDYWILFIQVNRISVFGGNLDAKGAGLWSCKTSGQSCPTGARSITFNWVNDAQISGLTSINSQLMHLVINSCKNVKVSNVKIIAPDLSPNTDGIHVQSSTGVTITNSIIKTGDDCISIGPGTRNLWIEKIQCGPGHGISIGSLGRNFDEDGVENVTVINSVFSGSDNGLRIKTWARPSKGFVRNVSYRNIVMKNVDNPIIIDQNYCPNNQGCPSQGSGIKISQVTYQNIVGTSATQVAMRFDCSHTNPCSGIKLRDIKLTYLKKTKAQSFCKNVAGSSGGVIMPENCL
ncbi:Pectin lyase-like superfamily protein [Perilla frutescens var. hirtella]|uniref:Pectin lyase-like superfamily protein n=1 Tax=Perilla frutescens var. hirtella TaxID=608512 RepID=A0AAD4NXS4_PERFH|nr:Pectin lyase-like superfamily protein [Perilla frutescens var. hirtella]KAH6770442.1 Pectin lyase-like superfamily protein [Perilla frutescens var. hirtella]KAH6815940.1 Pectin lyase-like superfamily protein [Perilla frutescens var. frutescens]